MLIRFIFKFCKIFLLPSFSSDFDEAWYERYEGKGVRSDRVDFEYLNKLC